MSLSVTLRDMREVDVYWSNITHNLSRMAMSSGLYDYIWLPDSLYITEARDLVIPLTIGLNILKDYPEYYRQFEDSDGCGTYDDFIMFVEEYRNVCVENPNAKISVSV